jgi:hypothetical protein
MPAAPGPKGDTGMVGPQGAVGPSGATGPAAYGVMDATQKRLGTLMSLDRSGFIATIGTDQYLREWDPSGLMQAWDVRNITSNIPYFSDANCGYPAVAGGLVFIKALPSRQEIYYNPGNGGSFLVASITPPAPVTGTVSYRSACGSPPAPCCATTTLTGNYYTLQDAGALAYNITPPITLY